MAVAAAAEAAAAEAAAAEAAAAQAVGQAKCRVTSGRHGRCKNASLQATCWTV